MLIDTLLKSVQTRQDSGTSAKSFNECIKKHGTTQPEKVISVYEFKDASFPLKINKSAVYVKLSFNVVKSILDFV